MAALLLSSSARVKVVKLAVPPSPCVDPAIET
jgi:hypothetical protein